MQHKGDNGEGIVEAVIVDVVVIVAGVESKDGVVSKGKAKLD